VTVVSVLSLKGAPGVTTLSCLLAATWPTPGARLVVEADPAGGDLAARFGLSATLGGATFAAAIRRNGGGTPLDPHLQQVPGGLPVLVAAAGNPVASGTDQLANLLTGAVRDAVPDGVAVIDVGRMVPDSHATDGWLDRSDGTVVVLRGDAAAALQLRIHAPRLVEVTHGKLGLVVVGGEDHRCLEVSLFTGIRALGDVPFDPHAAAVASGASSALRRLERSRLLAAVRRVGREIGSTIESSDGGPWSGLAAVDPQPPVAAGSSGNLFARRWRRTVSADATTSVAPDRTEDVKPEAAPGVGTSAAAGVR
jgi:hypothetical protein